ncbi:MAG: ribonuclease T [Thiohalomonadales bacterium]
MDVLLKSHVFLKVWIIVVFLFSVPSFASTVATGTFTATKTCQAYVSKSKRSNPDKTQLKIKKKYTIFEANRVVNPEWYRIRVQDANPVERWVLKACGAVNITGGGNTPVDGKKCQTAGLEDSYKLALSWQPAFCETHRDKPECSITSVKTYQARNFTLHGLWPNKKSCGTGYGFCGEVKSKPGDFCDYPILSLITEVRNELELVMPSAKSGSCLQRHQWYKHGTCQTKWSIDGYNTIAIDLARQFNESGIAYFISRNIGKQVSEADFFKRVNCSLGANAHKRLNIKCKNGNLVDIYINLPVDIKKGENLAELLKRSGEDFKSNCNGSFKIDPIGFVD